MPPISPTSMDWLKVAKGTPTQYAPSLAPKAPAPATSSVLGASAAAPGAYGASASDTTDPGELAFLSTQAEQLRSLLGRSDTALNQGLTNLEDDYNRNVGDATAEKNKLVTGQNQAKLAAYNTIDRNAGNGFRSLAQIIGRASGTGSSAFRDLLPNVIGKDVSSKRQAATTTHGQNLSNIEDSSTSVLADILRQRKASEEALRTGVEQNRQSINDQLLQNAAAMAQAKGGGFDAVRSAVAPFQSAIDNSRNTVESFFDRFRTPYTAPAVNPNLAAYTTDRSVINAKSQGGDTSNPYSSLLRKKLQGQA